MHILSRQLLKKRYGKLTLSVGLFAVGFLSVLALSILSGASITLKDFIGFITVGLSTAALGYFMVDACIGSTRPHLYSWLIWTIVNAIAWLNQWTHHAGPGAWSTLAMTGLAFLILCIAFQQRATTSISRPTMIDRWCLLGAVVSIVWLIVFKTGPGSIIAIAVTNVFAFVPTMRKSWRHPTSEPALNYGLNVVRQLLILMAIGSYNFVTVFFPLSLILLNGLTVMIIATRQRQLRRTQLDTTATL